IGRIHPPVAARPAGGDLDWPLVARSGAKVPDAGLRGGSGSAHSYDPGAVVRPLAEEALRDAAPRRIGPPFIRDGNECLAGRARMAACQDTLYAALFIGQRTRECGQWRWRPHVATC